MIPIADLQMITSSYKIITIYHIDETIPDNSDTQPHPTGEPLSTQLWIVIAVFCFLSGLFLGMALSCICVIMCCISIVGRKVGTSPDLGYTVTKEEENKSDTEMKPTAGDLEPVYENPDKFSTGKSNAYESVESGKHSFSVGTLDKQSVKKENDQQVATPQESVHTIK